MRIDHLLGYYRFYYMYEDPVWEMTLERMGVWGRVNEVMQSQMSVADKRYHIFDAIIAGIKRCFPQSALAQFFDQSGFMRPAHTVLVARKDFDNSVKYNREECGWYKQYSTEHNQDLLYAMLSPSEHGDVDYLGKILGNATMLLQPTDSVRICFYNPELGEEIIQAFMHYAQEQGKLIVCEDLGVVPKEISHSLWQQRAKRWRELYFGYKHFTDDPNNPYWFTNITRNDFSCLVSQDRVSARGWWEGEVCGKLAASKYYFSGDGQKRQIVKYLNNEGYLSMGSADLNVVEAALASVADCSAQEFVEPAPSIFGSGDEGIINIPGKSGFWTARAPVTIEDLLFESQNQGEPKNKCASDAVKLIRRLVSYKSRGSFEGQVGRRSYWTRVLAAYPAIGADSKQIRIVGEEPFVVDIVLYGEEISHAYVVFDSQREVEMTKMEIKHGLPEGAQIFRAYIPVEYGTHPYVIYYREAGWGWMHTREKGYLVGVMPGTDCNPVSSRYGQQKISSPAISGWQLPVFEGDVYLLWNRLLLRQGGIANYFKQEWADIIKKHGIRILGANLIDEKYLSALSARTERHHIPHDQYMWIAGFEIVENINWLLSGIGFGSLDYDRNYMVRVVVRNILQHAVSRDRETQGLVLVLSASGRIYIYIMDSGSGMPVAKVIQEGFRSIAGTVFGQDLVGFRRYQGINWIIDSRANEEKVPQRWDGALDRLADVSNVLKGMPFSGVLFAINFQPQAANLSESNSSSPSYIYPNRTSQMVHSALQSASDYWCGGEMQILYEAFSDVPPYSLLVDGGGGKGRLVRFLASLNPRGIIFVEPDAERIKIAREANSNLNVPIEFKAQSLELAFLPEGVKADAILCSHVLNHISFNTSEAILENLAHSLNENGRLVLSVAHSGRLFDTYAKSVKQEGRFSFSDVSKEEFEFIAIANELNILPTRRFSIATLRYILASHGFVPQGFSVYHYATEVSRTVEEILREERNFNAKATLEEKSAVSGDIVVAAIYNPREAGNYLQAGLYPSGSSSVFLDPRFTVVTEVHYGQRYGELIRRLSESGLQFSDAAVLMYPGDYQIEGVQMPFSVPSVRGEIPYEVFSSWSVDENGGSFNIILIGKYYERCVNDAFDSIRNWQYRSKKQTPLSFHFIGEYLWLFNAPYTAVEKFRSLAYETAYSIQDKVIVVTSQPMRIFVNGREKFSNIVSSAKQSILDLYYWATSSEFMQGIVQSSMVPLDFSVLQPEGLPVGSSPLKQPYSGYFWMPQDTKEQIEKYKNQDKVHTPDSRQNIYTKTALEAALNFLQKQYMQNDNSQAPPIEVIDTDTITFGVAFNGKTIYVEAPIIEDKPLYNLPAILVCLLRGKWAQAKFELFEIFKEKTSSSPVNLEADGEQYDTGNTDFTSSSAKKSDGSRYLDSEKIPLIQAAVTRISARKTPVYVADIVADPQCPLAKGQIDKLVAKLNREYPNGAKYFLGIEQKDHNLRQQPRVEKNLEDRIAKLNVFIDETLVKNPGVEITQAMLSRALGIHPTTFNVWLDDHKDDHRVKVLLQKVYKTTMFGRIRRLASRALAAGREVNEDEIKRSLVEEGVNRGRYASWKFKHNFDLTGYLGANPLTQQEINEEKGNWSQEKLVKDETDFIKKTAEEPKERRIKQSKTKRQKETGETKGQPSYGFPSDVSLGTVEQAVDKAIADGVIYEELWRWWSRTISALTREITQMHTLQMRYGQMISRTAGKIKALAVIKADSASSAIVPVFMEEPKLNRLLTQLARMQLMFTAYQELLSDEGEKASRLVDSYIGQLQLGNNSSELIGKVQATVDLMPEPYLISMDNNAKPDWYNWFKIPAEYLEWAIGRGCRVPCQHCCRGNGIFNARVDPLPIAINKIVKSNYCIFLWSRNDPFDWCDPFFGVHIDAIVDFILRNRTKQNYFAYLITKGWELDDMRAQQAASRIAQLNFPPEISEVFNLSFHLCSPKNNIITHMLKAGPLGDHSAIVDYYARTYGNVIRTLGSALHRVVVYFAAGQELFNRLTLDAFSGALREAGVKEFIVRGIREQLRRISCMPQPALGYDVTFGGNFLIKTDALRADGRGGDFLNRLYLALRSDPRALKVNQSLVSDNKFPIQRYPEVEINPSGKVRVRSIHNAARIFVDSSLNELLPVANIVSSPLSEKVSQASQMILRCVDTTKQPCCINHKAVRAIEVLCEKDNSFLGIFADLVAKYLVDENVLLRNALYEIVEVLNGHSCARKLPTLFAELLSRRLPRGELLNSLSACSRINAEMVPDDAKTTFPPNVKKGYAQGDIDLSDSEPALFLKLYRHARYYYIEYQGKKTEHRGKIIGFVQTYRPSVENIVFLGIRVFDRVEQGIGTQVMRWAARWAGNDGTIVFQYPVDESYIKFMLHCEREGILDSVEIALLSIEEIPLIPRSDLCCLAQTYKSDKQSSWQRVRNAAHVATLRLKLTPGTNIFVRGKVSSKNASVSSPSPTVSVIFQDKGIVVPAIGDYNFPIHSEDLEGFLGWFVPSGAEFESAYNPQGFLRLRGKALHSGIDLAFYVKTDKKSRFFTIGYVPSETNVYPVSLAKVAEASDWTSSVRLYDGKDFYAYGHVSDFKVKVEDEMKSLAQPLASLVAPDPEWVKAGLLPHLHFSVSKELTSSFIDPEPYLFGGMRKIAVKITGDFSYSKHGYVYISAGNPIRELSVKSVSSPAQNGDALKRQINALVEEHRNYRDQARGIWKKFEPELELPSEISAQLGILSGAINGALPQYIIALRMFEASVSSYAGFIEELRMRNSEVTLQKASALCEAILLLEKAKNKLEYAVFVLDKHIYGNNQDKTSSPAPSVEWIHPEFVSEADKLWQSLGWMNPQPSLIAAKALEERFDNGMFDCFRASVGSHYDLHISSPIQSLGNFNEPKVNVFSADEKIDLGQSKAQHYMYQVISVEGENFSAITVRYGIPDSGGVIVPSRLQPSCGGVLYKEVEEKEFEPATTAAFFEAKDRALETDRTLALGNMGMHGAATVIVAGKLNSEGERLIKKDRILRKWAQSLAKARILGWEYVVTTDLGTTEYDMLSISDSAFGVYMDLLKEGNIIEEYAREEAEKCQYANNLEREKNIRMSVEWINEILHWKRWNELPPELLTKIGVVLPAAGCPEELGGYPPFRWRLGAASLLSAIRVIRWWAEFSPKSKDARPYLNLPQSPNPLRITIDGFGDTSRTILRSLIREDSDIQIVGVNRVGAGIYKPSGLDKPKLLRLIQRQETGDWIFSLPKAYVNAGENLVTEDLLYQPADIIILADRRRPRNSIDVERINASVVMEAVPGVLTSNEIRLLAKRGVFYISSLFLNLGILFAAREEILHRLSIKERMHVKDMRTHVLSGIEDLAQALVFEELDRCEASDSVAATVKAWEVGIEIAERIRRNELVFWLAFSETLGKYGLTLNDLNRPDVSWEVSIRRLGIKEFLVPVFHRVYTTLVEGRNHTMAWITGIFEIARQRVIYDKDSYKRLIAALDSRKTEIEEELAAYHGNRLSCKEAAPYLLAALKRPTGHRLRRKCARALGAILIASEDEVLNRRIVGGELFDDPAEGSPGGLLLALNDFNEDVVEWASWSVSLSGVNLYDYIQYLEIEVAKSLSEKMASTPKGDVLFRMQERIAEVYKMIAAAYNHISEEEPSRGNRNKYSELKGQARAYWRLAQKHYQLAESQIGPGALTCQVTIARSQHEEGEIEAAISTYLDLIYPISAARIMGGVELGRAASMELVEFCRETRASAIEGVLNIYSRHELEANILAARAVNEIVHHINSDFKGATPQEKISALLDCCRAKLGVFGMPHLALFAFYGVDMGERTDYENLARVIRNAFISRCLFDKEGNLFSEGRRKEFILSSQPPFNTLNFYQRNFIADELLKESNISSPLPEENKFFLNLEHVYGPNPHRSQLYPYEEAAYWIKREVEARSLSRPNDNFVNGRLREILLGTTLDVCLGLEFRAICEKLHLAGKKQFAAEVLVSLDAINWVRDSEWVLGMVRRCIRAGGSLKYENIDINNPIELYFSSANPASPYIEAPRHFMLNFKIYDGNASVAREALKGANPGRIILRLFKHKEELVEYAKSSVPEEGSSSSPTETGWPASSPTQGDGRDMFALLDDAIKSLQSSDGILMKRSLELGGIDWLYVNASCNACSNMRSLADLIGRVIIELEANRDDLEEPVWKIETIAIPHITSIIQFVSNKHIIKGLGYATYRKLIGDDGALLLVRDNLKRFVELTRQTDEENNSSSPAAHNQPTLLLSESKGRITNVSSEVPLGFTLVSSSVDVIDKILMTDFFRQGYWIEYRKPGSGEPKADEIVVLRNNRPEKLRDEVVLSTAKYSLYFNEDGSIQIAGFYPAEYVTNKHNYGITFMVLSLLLRFNGRAPKTFYIDITFNAFLYHNLIPYISAFTITTDVPLPKFSPGAAPVIDIADPDAPTLIMGAIPSISPADFEVLERLNKNNQSASSPVKSREQLSNVSPEFTENYFPEERSSSSPAIKQRINAHIENSALTSTVGKLSPFYAQAITQLSGHEPHLMHFDGYANTLINISCPMFVTPGTLIIRAQLQERGQEALGFLRKNFGSKDIELAINVSMGSVLKGYAHMFSDVDVVNVLVFVKSTAGVLNKSLIASARDEIRKMFGTVNLVFVSASNITTDNPVLFYPMVYCSLPELVELHRALFLRKISARGDRAKILWGSIRRFIMGYVDFDMVEVIDEQIAAIHWNENLTRVLINHGIDTTDYVELEEFILKRRGDVAIPNLKVMQRVYGLVKPIQEHTRVDASSCSIAGFVSSPAKQPDKELSSHEPITVFKRYSDEYDSFMIRIAQLLYKYKTSQPKEYKSLAPKVIKGEKIKNKGVFWPSHGHSVASYLAYLGVSPEDSMVDLGGGYAELAFFIAHIFSIPATSVEVCPAFHKFGNFLNEELTRSGYIAPGQVTLINKDFISPEIFFSRYSILYYFAWGTFSKKALASRLLAVKPGSKILIYGSLDPEVEARLIASSDFEVAKLQMHDFTSFARAYVKQQTENNLRPQVSSPQANNFDSATVNLLFREEISRNYPASRKRARSLRGRASVVSLRDISDIISGAIWGSVGFAKEGLLSLSRADEILGHTIPNAVDAVAERIDRGEIALMDAQIRFTFVAEKPSRKFYFILADNGIGITKALMQRLKKLDFAAILISILEGAIFDVLTTKRAAKLGIYIGRNGQGMLSILKLAQENGFTLSIESKTKRNYGYKFIQNPDGTKTVIKHHLDEPGTTVRVDGVLPQELKEKPKSMLSKAAATGMFSVSSSVSEAVNSEWKTVPDSIKSSNLICTLSLKRGIEPIGRISLYVEPRGIVVYSCTGLIVTPEEEGQGYGTKLIFEGFRRAMEEALRLGFSPRWAFIYYTLSASSDQRRVDFFEGFIVKKIGFKRYAETVGDETLEGLFNDYPDRKKIYGSFGSWAIPLDLFFSKAASSSAGFADTVLVEDGAAGNMEVFRERIRKLKETFFMTAQNSFSGITPHAAYTQGVISAIKDYFYASRYARYVLPVVAGSFRWGIAHPHSDLEIYFVTKNGVHCHTFNNRPVFKPERYDCCPMLNLPQYPQEALEAICEFEKLLVLSGIEIEGWIDIACYKTGVLEHDWCNWHHINAIQIPVMSKPLWIDPLSSDLNNKWQECCQWYRGMYADRDFVARLLCGWNECYSDAGTGRIAVNADLLEEQKKRFLTGKNYIPLDALSAAKMAVSTLAFMIAVVKGIDFVRSMGPSIYSLLNAASLISEETGATKITPADISRFIELRRVFIRMYEHYFYAPFIFDGDFIRAMEFLRDFNERAFALANYLIRASSSVECGLLLLSTQISSPVAWYVNRAFAGIDFSEFSEHMAAVAGAIKDRAFPRDHIIYTLFPMCDFSEAVLEGYALAVREFNRFLREEPLTPENGHARIEAELLLLHKIMGETGKRLPLPGQYQHHAGEAYDGYKLFMREIFGAEFNSRIHMDTLEAGAYVFTKYSDFQIFFDGNHRTGRFLLNLMLLKMGYAPFFIGIKNAKNYAEITTSRKDFKTRVALFKNLLGESIETRKALPSISSPVRQPIGQGKMHLLENVLCDMDLSKFSSNKRLRFLQAHNRDYFKIGRYAARVTLSSNRLYVSDEGEVVLSENEGNQASSSLNAPFSADTSNPADSDINSAEVRTRVLLKDLWDVLCQINIHGLEILLFGSYADARKDPRDVDLILMVAPDVTLEDGREVIMKFDEIEKTISNFLNMKGYRDVEFHDLNPATRGNYFRLWQKREFFVRNSTLWFLSPQYIQGYRWPGERIRKLPEVEIKNASCISCPLQNRNSSSPSHITEQSPADGFDGLIYDELALIRNAIWNKWQVNSGDTISSFGSSSVIDDSARRQALSAWKHIHRKVSSPISREPQRQDQSKEGTWFAPRENLTGKNQGIVSTLGFPRVINLVDIGKYEQGLKEVVSRHKGRVAFFVHAGGEYLEYNFNRAIYRDNLRKYFEQNVSGVVFVLGGNPEFFKGIHSGAVVIWIESIPYHPIPKTENVISLNDMRTWVLAWQPLLNEMRILGVRRVSPYGGEKVIFISKGKIKTVPVRESGCAGCAIYFLSDFDIEVYPQLCCGSQQQLYLNPNLPLDKGAYMISRAGRKNSGKEQLSKQWAMYKNAGFSKGVMSNFSSSPALDNSVYQQIFFDGNHRTGRFLLNLMLLKMGYAPFFIGIKNAKNYAEITTS
ncbi:MAG: 4-alpha-glucanotransferase, partial [Candidatus Omnitrophota bacterium]